jgi:hypothetical protein
MTKEKLKQKLIVNHKYVILDNERNQTYYGKCICNESYLFYDVTKYGLHNEYIGVKYFSEKDHFINTHAKND